RGQNGSFFFMPFRLRADGCGGYRLRRCCQGGRWPGPAHAARGLAMPYEFRDEGTYYYARLSGSLDRAELNAMTQEVERLEDAGVMLDRITDLTSVERIDVGFEEVFAVAQRRAERRVATPIRSALVANRPVQFGFARMFQMLN